MIIKVIIIIIIYATKFVASFAVVFRDVTQRSPERKISFGGALRDIPKDGCEGDYKVCGGSGRQPTP